MYVGRVIGTVVATRIAAGLEGQRLLLIQPTDHVGVAAGQPEVAVDGSGTAGRGDLVFLVGSREASVAVTPSFVPVDAAVVGLVDRLP